MPLFEYACRGCGKKFEQIQSSNPKAEEKITCPSCSSEKVEKLISRFAVAGQGDLRESTMHGCHGCYTGHKHGSSSGSSEN